MGVSINFDNSSTLRGNVGKRSRNSSTALRQAALALELELKELAGLIGVAFDPPGGGQNPGLRVLMRESSDEARRRVPPEFRGFRVNIDVVGDIALGG